MKKIFYFIIGIVVFISIIALFSTDFRDFEVINLIDNGNFSTDELVWKNEGLYLTAIVNNELELTRSADGVSFYLTHNTLTMIEGHSYSISFVIDPEVNTKFVSYVDSVSGHIHLVQDIGLTTTEISSEIIYDGDSDFVIYVELVNSSAWFGAIDNFVVVDITENYSEEDDIPTYEEFLVLIASAPDYFDSFSYEIEETVEEAVEVIITLISSLLVIVVLGSFAFVLFKK